MPRIKLLPEDEFALVLTDEKIKGWVREYRFHPDRKWRSDFCWPAEDVRLFVEIEGGIWTDGRHVRGKIVLRI